MQGGDEDHLVTRLQLVVQFTLQFPVRIIHEDQDSRAPEDKS